VLREPGYGWARDGATYVPTTSELMREWRTRMNLFRSRKSWLAVTGWAQSVLLLMIGSASWAYFFSWQLLAFSVVSSIAVLGIHGTVYLHRYSTHRAFVFRNAFWLFICRNLTLKIIPEETYVISHHVHHVYSDGPGDPYNARCGWLYCFLAGELHQQIRHDLSPRDYESVCRLLRHTGMTCNTYEQYQRWGTATNPGRLWLHYLLNWAFWYAVFFLVGGHPLATGLFFGAGMWSMGMRAHNYDLHAGGKDRRRDGIDFDRRNLSVNASWPGFIAGEWHNNHHLYPNSVRSGFLPWQLDTSFAFISFYRAIGGITSWRDSRPSFYAQHYEPWLAARASTTLESAQSERSG
jgi:sn-1 stearoyl-lipid 9-desaturase